MAAHKKGQLPWTDEMRSLLVRHREARGLTQPEIGKAIGRAGNYYSKIERGERGRAPSPQMRAALAAMLEIPPQELGLPARPARSPAPTATDQSDRYPAMQIAATMARAEGYSENAILSVTTGVYSGAESEPPSTWLGMMKGRNDELRLTQQSPAAAAIVEADKRARDTGIANAKAAGARPGFPKRGGQS